MDEALASGAGEMCVHFLERVSSAKRLLMSVADTSHQAAPRLLSFHVHVTDVLSGLDGLCLNCCYTE